MSHTFATKKTAKAKTPQASGVAVWARAVRVS